MQLSKLANFRKISPSPSLSLLTGILSLLSILGLGLNLFWIQNPLIGAIFALFYFGTLSLVTGSKIFTPFPRLQQWVFGFLIVISELIVTGTATYYFYKITPLVSFLLLFIPFLGIFFIKKNQGEPSSPPFHLSRPTLFLSGAIVITDLILLFYLFTHRTTDLAASPWQMVSPLFFILYLLGTALLFWKYATTHTNSTTFLLTSLHVFVGLSVTSLLYPLGFGFDAFIHRATEEWIFQHGFIDPKTPYYIGQYSFVVFLSHITSLSIQWIDIYLIPFLASISLPAVTIFSFQEVFPKKAKLAPFLFWLILFLPFLSLSLTTPHNLVVLLTLVSIYCLLLSLSEKFPVWILFLFAVTAIATHALVGIPLFVVIFFFFIVKNLKNLNKVKIPIILLILSLAVLLPAMFTFNALRIHAPLPQLNNPIEKIPQFLKLFERPYWYAHTDVIHFEILYFFERLMVPFFILLALIGTISIETSKTPNASNKHFWIFTTSFLGFFVSAFTLAGTIVFPDVVAYEQSDYPLRLMRVSLLFLLPGAMYGTGLLTQKIQEWEIIMKHKKLSLFLVLLILSSIFTCVLYLSYPQRNIKVRFPGYNVTETDKKTVETIHNRHTDYNYIVLSNQLVSAMALKQYSFAKYFSTSQGEIFYYSIPTGGKLYSLYGKMIYQGQKREYMEEAMQLTGVNTAYFVVNKYWANSNAIIEGAKQTADEYFPIDNGNVWIFVYFSSKSISNP